MNRKPSFAGWLLSVALLLACATAAAKEESGTVVSLRGGTLERMEKDAWRGIGQGKKVAIGERLRTGKAAVAVIDFPAVGRFVMGPGSEIEMGREPKDFTTKMNRGALWMQTALPAGGRAAISTPIAIAGVRGTAFSMVFGEGEKAVCACTCAGNIEVTTPDGKKLNVPRGEYVAIDAGQSVPARAQASAPVLEQTGTVFDFCQACHVVGGKGKLKPDWK
ncbi:MAG: FecR domain-containing protein [Rhodocyclales bacterium]|nr:FecR domain-containing protein [Rhodocyclales bacterium]